MAVVVSKSGMEENEEALLLLLKLKTVPLYYRLSYNFIFSFAINLHMEHSKVVFYHYL